MKLLAEEAGLSRSYLSDVERSEPSILLDKIYRITEGVEIDTWRLLK